MNWGIVTIVIIVIYAIGIAVGIVVSFYTIFDFLKFRPRERYLPPDAVKFD